MCLKSIFLGHSEGSPNFIRHKVCDRKLQKTDPKFQILHKGFILIIDF